MQLALIIGGTVGLVAIGIIWYLKYQLNAARLAAENASQLQLALHDARARVSALEAEVSGLQAKAAEIDETEARDIVASGDSVRAIGFLRASFPNSKN